MNMKTRQEIKAIAKEAMSRQRGTSILLILVPIALALVLGCFAWIPFIGPLISLAGTVVIIVLAVQLALAFALIYRGQTTQISDLFSGIGVNFARKLGGMLWMVLFVYLWSLLLVIPGIVKAYSYMMTPYILAEYPNVNATEALKLSMRMTNGHKGKLFMLDLSFIGWALLSALTAGILGIVYVFPYMETSRAGYYTELRDHALTNGVIRQEELA